MPYLPPSWRGGRHLGCAGARHRRGRCRRRVYGGRCSCLRRRCEEWRIPCARARYALLDLRRSRLRAGRPISLASAGTRQQDPRSRALRAGRSLGRLWTSPRRRAGAASLTRNRMCPPMSFGGRPSRRGRGRSRPLRLLACLTGRGRSPPAPGRTCRCRGRPRTRGSRTWPHSCGSGAGSGQDPWGRGCVRAESRSAPWRR